MTCPRCGAPVPPDGAFCARCGLPFARMNGQPGAAPPPRRKSAAAIVLIVLAVVFGGGIFLIAILAAILFPVFAKTRENARLASCESNVKQIDLGVMQYTQDWDNAYPVSAARYKKAVFPYIRTEQVFHCPSDTAGGDSYSFNRNLQAKSLDTLFNPVAPGTAVAVYEGKNQVLTFRHSQRAVVGFADGHVKALGHDLPHDLTWKP